MDYRLDIVDDYPGYTGVVGPVDLSMDQVVVLDY